MPTCSNLLLAVERSGWPTKGPHHACCRAAGQRSSQYRLALQVSRWSKRTWGRAGAAHLYGRYCRTGRGGIVLAWGCTCCLLGKHWSCSPGFQNVMIFFANLTERNFTVTCKNFDGVFNRCLKNENVSKLKPKWKEITSFNQRYWCYRTNGKKSQCCLC